MSLFDSMSEMIPSITGEMILDADIDTLKSDIKYYIGTVRNNRLKSLCYDVIENEPLFWTIPASATHNRMVGGLAKHTLETIIYANSFYSTCLSKEILSKDLLIAGALIHDIGKVRLVGEKITVANHIMKGIEVISGMLTKYDFTQKERMQILGVIESHHSRFDLDTGVKFTTLEAYLVSVADKYSALFSITAEQAREGKPFKFYYQTKLEKSVF